LADPELKTVCTVIVLNFNGEKLLPACLDSLSKQKTAGVDVVVVDNASTDGSAKLVAEKYPWVQFLPLDKNYGFSGANNVALRYAIARKSDYVLLLNNDTFAAPDFISELLAVIQSDPKTAAVCPKIYFAHEPHKLWYAGGDFSLWTGLQGIVVGRKSIAINLTMKVLLPKQLDVPCWFAGRRWKKWGSSTSSFGFMRRILTGL